MLFGLALQVIQAPEAVCGGFVRTNDLLPAKHVVLSQRQVGHVTNRRCISGVNLWRKPWGSPYARYSVRAAIRKPIANRPVFGGCVMSRAPGKVWPTLRLQARGVL